MRRLRRFGGTSRTKSNIMKRNSQTGDLAVVGSIRRKQKPRRRPPYGRVNHPMAFREFRKRRFTTNRTNGRKSTGSETCLECRRVRFVESRRFSADARTGIVEELLAASGEATRDLEIFLSRSVPTLFPRLFVRRRYYSYAAYTDASAQRVSPRQSAAGWLSAKRARCFAAVPTEWCGRIGVAFHVSRPTSRIITWFVRPRRAQWCRRARAAGISFRGTNA